MRPQRPRGFTLLESVLALALLGGFLGIASLHLAGTVRAYAHIDDKARALLMEENARLLRHVTPDE